MIGQRNSTTLSVVEGSISQGMVQRLINYAQKEAKSVGFEDFTLDAQITVYNIDEDSVYTVRWQNKKGGYLELRGIHTNKGWPTLDYGFNVGVED